MVAIRNLGLQDYESTWQDMQRFTQNRDAETEDEIWITEHPPVYTLGLNGKREHLLNTGDIPVINTDRGGQVTYHGPGQLVIYTLIDIKRLNLGVRQLVTVLEQAMISALNQYGIIAVARADAPGVYVDHKKIGSIGLRIKRNCSYHGLSLNNQMDLRPFDHINTCGYPGLAVTQLTDLGITVSNAELAIPVTQAILTALQNSTPLSPLLLDVYMDVGSRAMHGAIAERARETTYMDAGGRAMQEQLPRSIEKPNFDV